MILTVEPAASCVMLQPAESVRTRATNEARAASMLAPYSFARVGSSLEMRVGARRPRGACFFTWAMRPIHGHVSTQLGAVSGVAVVSVLPLFSQSAFMP